MQDKGVWAQTSLPAPPPVSLERLHVLLQHLQHHGHLLAAVVEVKAASINASCCTVSSQIHHCIRLDNRPWRMALPNFNQHMPHLATSRVERYSAIDSPISRSAAISPALACSVRSTSANLGGEKRASEIKNAAQHAQGDSGCMQRLPA